MNNVNKLTQKPKEILKDDILSRYELLGLTDNPFPAQPAVDKLSEDPRINGEIFDREIRAKELQRMINNFIKEPKNSPNNLRLGYLIDTSYIGRGNGKSAFLINSNDMINRNYCLDISEGNNKCFSVYVSPSPGGRCKSFSSFIDSIFDYVWKTDIIESCLTILRLEALDRLFPEIHKDLIRDLNEKEILKLLNSPKELSKLNIDLANIENSIAEQKLLGSVNQDFPLKKNHNNLFYDPVTKECFKKYYNNLKKIDQKIEFLFSDMIAFFQAANFNGAFILVDDFERIPDFQSSRQRKDFAIELRRCLFDGPYRNSRYGFYSFILVFHAGVPGMISDAWSESGLEHRSPIAPTAESKHIIRFEKLERSHVSLLIKSYLSKYRFVQKEDSSLDPFTEDAIEYIGQMLEYNASKILKYAYELIEIAANEKKTTIIDRSYCERHKIDNKIDVQRQKQTIDNAPTPDLSK